MATFKSKAENIRDKGYSNSMDGYEEPEIIYFTPGKNSMDEKTINITIPNPYKMDGNLTERGYASSTEGMQGLTWRGYPSSSDGMKEQELKNAHYMSAFDDNEEDLLSIYATYPTLEVFEIPEGLGDQFAYMGWQKVTKESSPQYALRGYYGMNFDDEGFAKIKDRYVIATTTKFGDVGQCLDVVLEDGKVLQCVIGDIKNQEDDGCTEWGHTDGHCVVEFVVDCETWYQPGWEKGSHVNPGTEDCHPEWGTVKKVIKVDNNYLG